MKVWVLIDKYNGDVKAVLNETGKRNVEKQLMELGREEAIIDGEYPVNARNAIGQKYKEAGWDYVYHITSSEHGDRPGLTHFIFSTEKPDDKVVCGFYIV